MLQGLPSATLPYRWINLDDIQLSHLVYPLKLSISHPAPSEKWVLLDMKALVNSFLTVD